MVDFATAETPQEFIEAVRATFRAYVPESDAWAQPNFFSVNATIIGGLAWTAWNEARNGIDMRVNPQTASGEYLDIIAAQPPLFMTRLGPTGSNGYVLVNLPALAVVPAGYQFKTAGGIVYKATAETALTGGIGTVPVASVLTGSSVNSPNNQPLQTGDGTATSLGIYGGNDTENDDNFRRRMYAARSNSVFFGSACSYETAMLGIPGVSRAWAVVDGLVPKIMFLMEDKYPCGNPCGEPTLEDINDVQAYFADECLTNLYSTMVFEAAKSMVISPAISWDICPDNLAEIEDNMQAWLRANYDLGDGIRAIDIDRWLHDSYPDLGPSLICCNDYPPICGAVYNSVELIGG